MLRSFALVSLLVLLAAPLCAGAQTLASGTQIVTATRLHDVADKIVHGMISDADHDLVRAYNLPDQQVPSGTVEIEAQPPMATASYIAIPLEIRVNGKAVRTVMAGYRITSYVQSAVAAHDLPFGTVIADGDVVMGRVAQNGRPPVDPASLIGRQMNISVPHGGAMYVEMTRVNQLVKAGQPVVFVVRDGGVVLSADVVARQSGGLGAIVACYNPATHKELSGVVTGPAQVELTMPGSPEVLQ